MFQDHFKTQELPLARIKKIMKLDEDVKVWEHVCAIIYINSYKPGTPFMGHRQTE